MTEVVLNESLSRTSLLAIFAAMAAYAIAFVILAIDLSRRADQAAVTKKEAKAAAAKSAAGKTRKASLERVGLLFTFLAASLHAFGVFGRGIAAGRVPWSNMYEFSISGTLVIAVIFLVAQALKPEIRYISSVVTGFNTLVLGIATTIFYVQVKSLPPALQSYWLLIHVTVAVLATAFFFIAAALSITYLFKSASWLTKLKGKTVDKARKVLALFPEAERLEKLSYRYNVIGFILWTFTLIAGAIWAERAWHRYWGWDTKETWTFIIWSIYAGYLHATATRGWSGKRSAWLVVVGFAAIMFNFTIVNLFFKGLHVYSGLK